MKLFRGNLVFTKELQHFTTIPHGYIAVGEDGTIAGCYHALPEVYMGLPVRDFGERLLIPGFTDSHLHASQLPIPGILYNTQLIQWLNTLTMPQEIRLHDLEYAQNVYGKFVRKLVENGITHSVIMATIHADSTTILFDELVKSGLKAYVGKVSEDCNTLEDAMEDAETSIAESERFLLTNHHKSNRVKPIVTPTISMVCSRPVMTALARQAEAFHLPVQSHLSENREEIAFTLNMYPDCMDFLDSYEQAGLMADSDCVVAHSVHLTEREKVAIRDKGILVAHCPHSNLNLLSGMMKLAEYHDLGIRVGLGSDISGGHTLSPFANIVAAIQTGAALYLTGGYHRPVTASEAFYAATKGGGSFFGKTGSFEAGYCFDALVIDDLETLEYNRFSLEQRAEKMLYCCDDRNIVNVFIDGEEIETLGGSNERLFSV